MKARAKKVQKNWWGGYDYTEEELDVAASKLADNIKNCSCSMCCNPRRNGWWHDGKLTFPERRHIIDYKEGIGNV